MFSIVQISSAPVIKVAQTGEKPQTKLALSKSQKKKAVKRRKAMSEPCPRKQSDLADEEEMEEAECTIVDSPVGTSEVSVKPELTSVVEFVNKNPGKNIFVAAPVTADDQGSAGQTLALPSTDEAAPTSRNPGRDGAWDAEGSEEGSIKRKMEAEESRKRRR